MAGFEDAFFLIACQFCGKEFTAVTLDDHEDICEQLFQAISSNDQQNPKPVVDICKQVLKDVSSGEQQQNPKPVVENQENVAEQLEECCDICGDIYPVMCMQDHKNLCGFEDYDYALEVHLMKIAKESKEDLKSILNENKNEPRKESVELQKESSPAISKGNIQLSSVPDAKENNNKQQESTDAQGTKSETEMRKGSKLQRTRIMQAEETKKSKVQNKTGNVFTTDFEAESSKNFEKAETTRKTQKYPPIECEDVEDSTDDLKLESDEDCEETLEDFWTRAREILRRRRTLNAQ